MTSETPRAARGASLARWVQIPTLRLLVSIADEGSLGAGARAQRVAQSNASRSIALMERRLGYPLLVRSPQGSALTTEGALTVEWARTVLSAVDQMDAAVAALTATAPSGGELFRVGASMTVAEYLVPEWISQLTHTHPGVHPVLEISNSRDVIAKVRQGAVPLGFVETPEIPGDVRSTLVRHDQLVVVVAPGHPWADRGGALSLDELARTPLVEREAGSGTRAAYEAVLAARLPGTVRAEPVAELNGNAAILNSVAAGLGPAVLSELAVRQVLQDGRLLRVPVAGGELGRELRAVWYGVREPIGLAGDLLRIARGEAPRPR
ncbi:LysR family transcriptional regulator [Micrococcus terreus]|nr:LysR family transcriptional regulator [Micrococcus terreus]